MRTARDRLSSSRRWPGRLALAVTLVLGLGAPSRAQVAPAAGSTPPDDTPSVKVGGVIFADFTYQEAPTIRDAAGNDVHASTFNLTRAYINVTGNISHLISFRITPDVTRAALPGTAFDGTLAYRLKYAYLQINLDDWLPKGSWVKFGMQQTPFLDSVESIYRYRFQGGYFPEREGYMSSADIGATVRLNFPQNWGDVHVGFYNGEGYAKPEVNNQKAFMARVGFRPLHTHPILRTWRVQAFWIHDNYMNNAPRNRATFNTTFEHRLVNAGFDYLWTKDKVSSALTDGLDLYPALDGRGWSFWLTPKKPLARGASVEALIRHDDMKPGGVATATTITSPDARNQRTIAGLAYWFPKQGNVLAALMLDYEQLTFSSWTPSKPTQQRIFVHSLISF